MDAAKDFIVARLREDLVGPATPDERLDAYPSDVYLTGILFPQKAGIAPEEADQSRSEGRVDVDATDDSRDEVSLAAAKRPASAGLSFVVESSRIPRIKIRVDAGIYERERVQESNEAGDGNGKTSWRRRAVSWPRDDIALERVAGSRDFMPADTGIPGLALHIRTSPWGQRLLVTVAVANMHVPPESYERETIEELCFFQVGITVWPENGTCLSPRPPAGVAADEDTRMAALIYRGIREYAVGHTCSAEWQEEEGHVPCVSTTWIPTAVVKVMSADGVREFRPLTTDGTGPALSTKWLAESRGEMLCSGLRGVPDAYSSWLQSQEAGIKWPENQYAEVARRLLNSHNDGGERREPLTPECAQQACKHFELAVVARDRMLRSVDLIARDPNVQLAFRLANQAMMLQRQWAAPNDPPLMWRPFQLGFILLVIDSLATRNHADREIADLLWFPTGGGKTEAYLALIAFQLFLRRLRDGASGAGVACLMRYTLRLLTIQQFQRAAALICACELIRRGRHRPPSAEQTIDGPSFSLGLWVGGDATPNNFEKAQAALADESAHNRPDQLKHCPQHRDARLRWRADAASGRVFATCDHAECAWHREPLPIWTVDTDVYRERPSLVIGTIDKFAQLARRTETGAIFGRDGATLPPDLIIQDELHLISGALGTLAGLYEAAIDRMCSIVGDHRPKIIASTATIRQASSQIRALFDRGTCLFPPPVLDAANSGFAVEDDKEPGRLYLGVTTAGRSAKFTLQATAASIMQSAASPGLSDANRDDFWTLVAYFNSLRELGGALVLMQDDVTDSLRHYAARRGEPSRTAGEIMELTSRVTSTELKDFLEQLERSYAEPGSCDVVLASNMISVGVDIPRLGTMIVNGQPKSTAEYIQATSRVGRRRGGPGGLVVTLYNNAKARDRSHFEAFCNWHAAPYRGVEATSVTPFAPRARQKALHAALVILARHRAGDLSESVRNIGTHLADVQEFLDYLAERADHIDPDEALNTARDLEDFLERWQVNAAGFTSYWNDKSPNKSLLISAEKAVEIRARRGGFEYRSTPTPNSMRNVEPGTLFKLK